MSEITKEEEFKDTPTGNASRWEMELKAARKKLLKWHKEAADVVDVFLDTKSTDQDANKHLNLFTANIQMQRATMYGRPPQVSSSRRFGDAADDLARVASETQERLLNTDIERDSDSSAEAFGNALDDSLLCDFAAVRARYVVEMEKVEAKAAIPPGPNGLGGAPEVPETERKAREDVEIDYVHWRDMLWSPARVWGDVTWVAFLTLMSRKKLVEVFGEDVGGKIPLNAKQHAANADASKAHPWGRAEVWEIWDKDTKQVFRYCEGHNAVLAPVGVEVSKGGGQPDPYELEGFFPCPQPMILNATTSGFIPRPDYNLAKDLYESINTLETRCEMLTEALKVAGAYDKKAGTILESMLTNSENKLYPVDNWAMYAEARGSRGMIDWFPIEQIANTLNALRDVRREKIDLLYQVTGQSDLQRGQSTQAGATATEQRAKTRYGSQRAQKRQDRFAKFVADALRIKAQIISKHFDPQTILERCNCQFTPDRDVAPQAVQLLKERSWQFRIDVKPEAMALQDFGALKEEALEVLQTISMHIQGLGPLSQQLGPQAVQFGLEILKVSLARLKGGSAYEAVIDKAVAQLEAQQKQAAANPQPPAPDPKVMAAQMQLQGTQMKLQGDMMKEQAKLKADLVRGQAEVENDRAREQNQMIFNVEEARRKQMDAAALRPPDLARPKL